MKVLFSCMGTSDPVRGYRDGPLLHILRHYRPEKAVILLSDEARELDRKDGRLAAVKAFMAERWDGYRPEITVQHADLADPSDLDAVCRPITEAIRALSKEAPKDDKCKEAKSREHGTMIQSRQIAKDLGLKMKIG